MILSSPDPAADPFVAAVLLDLQRTAFEIEAAFLGTRDIPPLQQDEVQLAAFRGRWIVAWDGTDLLGAIAFTISVSPANEAEIEKVMVHPRAHRRGVASALVTRMLDELPGRDVVVTTGRDNPPGIAMYAKHGFVPERDEEVAPGLWLTHLRRPGSA